MLTYKELQIAIAAVKRRFASIRMKYPSVNAQLVFSSRSGKSTLEKSPLKILAKLPSMIIDDTEKAEFLETSSRLEFLQEQAADLRNAVQSLSKRLRKSAPNQRLAKSKASTIFATSEQNLKRLAQIIRLIEKKLSALASGLQYDETCQVAIILTELSGKLLRQLQKDGLINRNRVSHKKASIRVVLGKLSQFAQKTSQPSN